MTNPGHFLPNCDDPGGHGADALEALSDLVDNLMDPATPESHQGSNRLISFVIPIKDEEATIEKLVEGIREHLPEKCDLEVILIDDGSSDASWSKIEHLTTARPHEIRGIRFRHNAGKAVSLATGFAVARGSIIFTMDADLQDDPKEIPRFLSKLDEGFDLVSGWKRVRHDPWHKVLPSRVFNLLASYSAGVKLHDHNCGFKCYRDAVVRKLTLYGELHRVIPGLASMHGFRCTEIEVLHHPRKSGVSKYGLERILRGLGDLSTTSFLRRYRQRPSHLFNLIAGLQFAVAVSIALAGTIRPELSTTTCLLIAILLGAVSSSTFLGGLVAELVIRGRIQPSLEAPILTDTGIPQPYAPPRESRAPELRPVDNQVAMTPTDPSAPVSLTSTS